LIAKAVAAFFFRYYLIWIGAGFGSKMQTFSVGQILEANILRQTYFATVVICHGGVLQRLVPLECPFDIDSANRPEIGKRHINNNLLAILAPINIKKQGCIQYH